MRQKTTFLIILLAAAALVLAAAGRAEMAAPILKTSTEEIVVTASFTSFDPESNYRIGVGSPAKTINDYQMTLEQSEKPLPVRESTFTQGYLSAWFGLEEIPAKGFVFSGSDLTPDVRVQLQITMPRAEADRLNRFFIFVAKDYGSDTWYLEDGSEIRKENWE
ncbi:MAG TPA: hypothetical protein VLV83_13545 [Acidobacteriota bacterium]|nr:hypothetical protein [Acidobacteriota bacterium]